MNTRRSTAARHAAWPATALVVAACTVAALGAPPAAAQTPPPAAEDDAASYLVFGRDFGANCVARNGVTVTIRNRHPTRTLQVWLDRIHMGVGTGDRSRSTLAPGAEAEPLGCSRTDSGAQEWRLARARFVD